MASKLNHLNRRERHPEKDGKINKIKVSSQIDRLDYRKKSLLFLVFWKKKFNLKMFCNRDVCVCVCCCSCYSNHTASNLYDLQNIYNNPSE